MKLLRHRDTEALLDGQRVADDSPLAHVQSFFDDMRLEAAAIPAPAPRPKLASTLDGRRPIPRVATVPAHTAGETARGRAQSRLRSLAAMGAAGVVLFGGLASANALPGPLQRVSADLTSHFGVHIPGRTSTTPQHPRAPAPNVKGHTPGGGSTITPTHPATGMRTTPTTVGAVVTQPTVPISPTKPGSVTTTLPRIPTTVVTVPHPGGLPVPVTLPSIPLPIPRPILPTIPIGHIAGRADPSS